MKLLVVTNIPTPYRIAFFNVLQVQLQKIGGNLKVLYCAKSEPDRHWEINLHEQQFDYEILNGFHKNIKGLYLHFNPSILNKTKEFQPDYILYAGSWNMPTVVLSLLCNSLFNKKYKKIFWSEGHDGSMLHKGGIVPIIRKFIQNKFDAFAVPNERSKSYLFELLRLKKKPIVILPNSVDGNFFTKPTTWTTENSNAIKKEFGLPMDSKILLQVSTLNENKSVNELTDYWKKYKIENLGNYILVVIGEGSLKNELLKNTLGNESIFFLGNQPKENVRNILFSSDIFLLLTKNDANPLTLIEASFAKLPILTTKFAGNCNEIVVEDNGVILNEINFDRFDEGFQKCKQQAIEKKGEISFQNAIENFDIEKISNNFIQQLQNL